MILLFQQGPFVRAWHNNRLHGHYGSRDTGPLIYGKLTIQDTLLYKGEPK
jgi:hypothetical protein